MYKLMSEPLWFQKLNFQNPWSIFLRITSSLVQPIQPKLWWIRLNLPHYLVVRKMIHTGFWKLRFWNEDDSGIKMNMSLSTHSNIKVSGGESRIPIFGALFATYHLKSGLWNLLCRSALTKMYFDVLSNILANPLLEIKVIK